MKKAILLLTIFLFSASQLCLAQRNSEKDKVQQYGIDIGLLQLVKDVDQLLLLLICRARAWPVEILDGREPYGSYFVFR